MSDWASLTAPLLQRISTAAVGLPLPYLAFLHEDRREFCAADNIKDCLLSLSLVCQQWHSAVTSLLQDATWVLDAHNVANLCVLRSEPLEPQEQWRRARRLALERLDVRGLTWQEHEEWEYLRTEAGNNIGAAALLSNPDFQRHSVPVLRRALGIPELLVAELAPYTRLTHVGLIEDYKSSSCKAAAGKAAAPMRLAPLAGLPQLRVLQLELGIVDLAAVPRQVTELALVEVDRVLVPPAPGAAVTDRLMAAAEAQGLASLSVFATSECLVFETAGHVPLELDIGHIDRLLQLRNERSGNSSPHWVVQLKMFDDDALGKFRRLEMSRATP